MFNSNHMLISHHQENIVDFHIRDLEMTPKVLQGQRSWCIFINWTMVNILSIGTLGLEATVQTMRAILTFVTLK